MCYSIIDSRKATFSESWSVHSQIFEKIVHSCLVLMRLGETPVPIPNTTVKRKTAEGTMLVTAWENRRAPDYYGIIAQPVRAHA